MTDAGIKEGMKSILESAKSLFSNKKFQISLTVVLFLLILYSSTAIRLSNLPVLKDQTTGLYTSNDLDSLYFYREAEAMLNNNGALPKVDVLRAPALKGGWIPEILPNVMVGLYKIEKIFSPNITFNYSATISSPIIFAVLLIIFFFICLTLTNSKSASLISYALLAYSPAFLFRSIAGFYDHDLLGVLAIIILMMGTILAFKNFNKGWKQTVLYGLLLGFLTSIVLVSWGGAVTFILVLLPLAGLIQYLNSHEENNKFITLYLLWIFSSIFFPLLFGQSINSMLSRFTDSQGMVAVFILAFMVIDYLLLKYPEKLTFIKMKYEKLFSLGITLVLGIIGLIAMGKNPLTLVQKAWGTLVYPFFGNFLGRLGATVAENSQPYLTDLIIQFGKSTFYLFLLGLFFIGIQLIKHIKEPKYKIAGMLSWIGICFGILFSRTSPSIYILNGESFISQIIYIMGALSFFYFLFFIEYKEKVKLNVELILLIATAITVMINARAATRSFFLIAPFICIIAGFGIYEIIVSLKKSQEGKSQYLVWIGHIIIWIIVIFALFGIPMTSTTGIYQISSNQAKYVGPSTNDQWQNAMAWARNNTNSNDIFVHWWDYGYFIQTLANRPTVTDGGHAGGGNTDHYIGRHILTTADPKTAYSFMKTWNVSYLLIDPTDMGKYGAFSKIGSNDSWDRVSTGPAAGVSDDKNSKETSKGIIKVYNIGSCVDEDILYNNVLLPGITISKTQSMNCNSFIGGIVLEMNYVDNNSIIFKQPEAVFVYNNQQYRVPIKNIFFQGKQISFEKGLDAAINVIPRVTQTSDGKISLDMTGALIYLSPRVYPTLLGQLYVLNDPFGKYSGLTIADSEDNSAVKYFKQSWGIKDDFVYFNGLQGPLKIWKVNYPENISVYPEFFNYNFTFGGMDKKFN